MAKADGIRPGVLPPGQVGQKPALNEAEQAKVKQGKAGQITAADAARIASQAGFVKKKGARKGAPDIGDSSGAPIPLPNDDVDPDAWSQDRLDAAQGNLTLASAQFDEAAKAGETGQSLGAAIVGSSYMPTEEDLEEMEDIAKRKRKEPVPLLGEMTNSVGALFGIELDDDVPPGHKALAAGLVVAGEQESVEVEKSEGKKGLKEDKLAGGLKKVTERGNQAVGEAQKMNKGINKELNLQRTFMFKR